MGESNKNDLRAQRTRHAIRRAFTELLLETDASKITVKAISDRAEINRKTFYLHYETLDALFDEVLNGVLDEYFKNHEETPETPEDIDGHAQRFFRYLAQLPPHIEKLIFKRNYYGFGRKLYETQMLRYRDAGNPFGWMPVDQQDLVLHFIRMTAFDWYREWVRNGKKVPIDDAARLLGNVTCHGVEGLMR